MTTTNKVIASVTAAAAIAGGVYTVVEVTDDSASTTETAAVVDDVTAATVETPKVTIPTVQIPKIEIATVDTPKINAVTIISPSEQLEYGLKGIEIVDADGNVKTASVGSISVNTATVSTTSVTVYNVTLPEGKAVTVQSPTVAAIVAVVPSVAQIVVDNPKITVAQLITKLVDMPNVDAATIQKIALTIPTVEKGDNRIPLIQAFMAECQKYFKDQRAISHDKQFIYDNKNIQEWLSLVKANEGYTMNYIACPKNIKMVAEIHYPIDTTVLNDNLQFYANKGYNAALITFGYQGENISQLLDICDFVKSKGMTCWFAYGGKQTLNETVFKNPTQLQQTLSKFATKCDGFIIGWRRTSLHLYEQDAGFTNFLLKSVRNANSKIPVLGETYYGQTASSNEIQRNLQYNIPENSSGTVITGLGFNGVAVESCLSKLLIKIANIDKVAVIVGDKPYYGSSHYNGKTFAENFAIKQALETRWLKAGVSGTITLHGDGSDGVYQKTFNDNIANMKMQ